MNTSERQALTTIAVSAICTVAASAAFTAGTTVDVNGMQVFHGPGGPLAIHWGTWSGQSQHRLGGVTSMGGVTVTSTVHSPTHVTVVLDVFPLASPFDPSQLFIEIPGLTATPSVTGGTTAVTGPAWPGPGTVQPITGATPAFPTASGGWIRPSAVGDGVRWAGGAPYTASWPGVHTLTIDLFAVLPSTPGDLDGDGLVDGTDLAMLLGTWGPCSTDCGADIDGNGVVDGTDLAILLGQWNP